MCLAEAGYDPSLVRPPTEAGYSFTLPAGVVPPEISWQARELACADAPKCLRCALGRHRWRLDDGVACRATRRLVLDCGAHENQSDSHGDRTSEQPSS